MSRRTFWMSSISLKRLADEEEAREQQRLATEFVADPAIKALDEEETALYAKAGLKPRVHSLNWNIKEKSGPLVRQLYLHKHSDVPASNYRKQWNTIYNWFEALHLSDRQLATAYPHLPYWSGRKPVKRIPKAPPIPEEIMYLINLDRLMEKQGD